jgi:hypothetical protein
LFILSYSITSGLLQLSATIKPKYLNLEATVIFLPFTNKSPLQLIYIASVFDILISSALSTQNLPKQLVKSYNSSGEGASRTTSSAKASKKSYNIAISKIYRLVGIILFFSKYKSRSGYN